MPRSETLLEANSKQAEPPPAPPMDWPRARLKACSREQSRSVRVIVISFSPQCSPWANSFLYPSLSH